MKLTVPYASDIAKSLQGIDESLKKLVARLENDDDQRSLDRKATCSHPQFTTTPGGYRECVVCNLVIR